MNWLRGCIRFLSSKTVIPFINNSAIEKTVDRILEMFLDWDLRDTASPENVSLLIPELHMVHRSNVLTQFPTVLQVDEIYSICGAESNGEVKTDLKNANMFKLLLTDGFKQAVAFDFSGFLKTCQRGTKIAVQNVFVRRGVLLLTPQDTILLGGEVKNFRTNSVSHSNDNPRSSDRLIAANVPANQQQQQNYNEEERPENDHDEIARSSILQSRVDGNVFQQPIFQRTNKEGVSTNHSINNIVPLRVDHNQNINLNVAHTSQSNPNITNISANSSKQSFSYTPTASSSSSSSSALGLNPLISLCSPIFPSIVNSPTEMELADHEEVHRLFPTDCHSPMLSEDLLSSHTPPLTQKQDNFICNNATTPVQKSPHRLKYCKDLALFTPSSRFLMRGTADRVLVFQTSSDGNEFEVMISFDDGFSPDPVPAIVCTSVVTTFLGMSPADYSAILGALDQKSVKKTKNEVVCRFRSFQGVFWVEKQLSELIVTKGKGSSSKLIADMVLVDYAEDDAVQLCKSMMK